MRAITAADTLQIDVTNACVLRCAGCTHLCGHHKEPFMLTMEEFTRTLDSLQGYNSMIGLIGGEPLLVPWFGEMMSELRKRFPREQLGLWSVFPAGAKFSRYREGICETFGNILLNDHTRSNIMHAPILVASGEYFENLDDLYIAADACWVANRWSPSVTNKGAFFCEVAAELDQLFDGPGGWKVEPGWWKRTPKDYTAQIERWCSKCGGCLPLARKSSQEEICDISEGNARLLAGRSRKVDNHEVRVFAKGEFVFDPKLTENNGYPDQSPYKDMEYRQGIAARYGIFLTMNRLGYWDPQLMDGPALEPKQSLFQIMKANYPSEASVVPTLKEI